MIPNRGGKKFYALGRLKPGQMNKGERLYAENLERMKTAGLILWWKFEGLKLRLADNTFYTPDFNVLAADCVLECHEIKGFWQDDARAKIKIAADMYPFRFKAMKPEAQKRGGGWVIEDFSGPAEELPTSAPLFEEPPKPSALPPGDPF